jgi:hypothetical protein
LACRPCSLSIEPFHALFSDFKARAPVLLS